MLHDDPVEIAAQALEKQAARLWERSEHLLTDARRLQTIADKLRKDNVAGAERELALIQMDADYDLTNRRAV